MLFQWKKQSLSDEDGDYEARSEYKKVTAKVEERTDLIKRMRDEQTQGTIQANLKMDYKETLDKREWKGRST